MEVTLLIIILLTAPLAGGVLAFFLKPVSDLLSIAGVSISFLVAIYLLLLNFEFKGVFEWLPGYKLTVLADSVALILISLVTLVSTLVYIFSVEYMKADGGKNRYFLKLGFFVSSMIGLLLADHLILLFVFWELVGLASYLLIGFWYQKEGVPASARLAFMVNRVADVALLAGILFLNASGILQISEFENTWLLLPSLLVAIGAFGKSAQFPFSGWLIKAMVGPTPVSALIHAATMVAVGVYLLFRVSPFMHPDALMTITLIGTFTALYGGLCALMQHDIKKVLAYSTISQLGYMVLGTGVGAPEASLFHLFTHAFFKAGLFLGVGVIIRFMHQVTQKDAQDMRNMGGLRSHLPWTYRTFLICSMSLAGLPLLSGFMSKEGIIIAGWEWANSVGTWAYIVPDIALVTAFLTALYVGRMLLLVFWGESRLKESMSLFSEVVQLKLPLIILAFGSLWIFYGRHPMAHETWLTLFWGKSFEPGFDMVAAMVMFLSLLMAIGGLVLAFSFFKQGTNYNRSYSQMTSGRFPTVLDGLYLTSLYQVFGKGVEKIAEFTFWVDRRIFDGLVHFIGIGGVVLSKVIALIDRFLVDGLINLAGYASGLIGKLLARLSSKDLQTQLAWLLVGIILILSWILFF